MATRNIPLAEAGPRVEDVMMRGPRAVPPDTTVAEARETFENPRVRLLLVARGDTFAGAVTRDTISDDVAGDVTLGELVADDDWHVAPGEPVTRAMELLDAERTDRLPVVADDGKLVGLVCLNRRQGLFCVDA
jgi:CBS domain-containing protein